MNNSAVLFAQLLKSNGLSNTKPRNLVFRSLFAYGLQTIAELSERCPEIDRASVYRTVNTLEKIGVIVRVQQGFKYKIELSDAFLPHHHHIICHKCGKQRDIEQQKLELLLSEVAEKEDFQLTSHKLELVGMCGVCRARS